MEHIYDRATHESAILTGAECHNDCPICPATLGGECIEDQESAVLWDLNAGPGNGTTPDEYRTVIGDSGPNHIDINLEDR